MVGLDHATSSLARPLRHHRFSLEIACVAGAGPWDFFLRRKKKLEPATQAALEIAQLYWELLRAQLGASLLFRKLRVGHTAASEFLSRFSLNS